MSMNLPKSSLWFDLLCLHGYIIDRRWLREPVCTTHEPGDSKCDRDAQSYPRRCLGIGDGVIRTQ